jgi:hypothetical protein
MSVSHLQLTKSETRQLAESDHRPGEPWRFQPSEWNMSNRTFFSAFVVIAAVLAIAALVLR